MTDETDFEITPEMKTEARIYKRAREIQEYAELVYAQMIAKRWTPNEMDAFCIHLIRSMK